MRRRLFLAAAATTPAARAQSSTRLVVPFAAGGPTDVVARLLAQALAPPAIVENRAGGAALPATEHVARAPRDGSVLLFTTVVHAVHRALHGARLGFDPLADFAPVALVGVVPLVVLVRPDGPADMAALLAMLRAEPGRHAYGSSGVGGASHLGVELLKSMAGLDIGHIPYRGTAPALADLLAGRVLLVMDSVATGAAQVRAGALRALATTSDRRSAALPEVPVLAEMVPGFAATTWNAVLAPAGTPPATVQALSDAIARVLREPGFAARLAELGVQVPDDLSPASAAAFVAAETRKWDALVAGAGIRAE